MTAVYRVLCTAVLIQIPYLLICLLCKKILNKLILALHIPLYSIIISMIKLGGVKMVFLYFIGILIWGVVWGVATNKVLENKGYDDNWFWWGFFFGFIAMIVAVTKPENQTSTNVHSYDSSPLSGNASKVLPINKSDKMWKCSCGEYNQNYETSCHNCGKSQKNSRVNISKSWRCECGALNTISERTCHRCGKPSNRPPLWKCKSCSAINQPEDTICISCGTPKEVVDSDNKKTENVSMLDNTHEEKNDEVIIANLKKYKELADTGVITQEEFDAKKKQLLGL